GDAVEETVEVGVPGGGDRHQQVQRSAAHRRDVAHVDGDRLPAEVLEGEIGRSVDTGHDSVGGEQEGAVGWLDHGGVVADVGETLTQAPDQGELVGQFSAPIACTHRA